MTAIPVLHFRTLPSLLFRFVFLLGLALVLASFTAHAQRQPEKLGRAVIAQRGVDTGGNGTNNWTGAGINQVYVGWRLFATDPENISFNVYRSANGAAAVKLNASPITTSTNYVDTTATLTVPNAYHVRPVVKGIEGAASEAWTLPANSAAEPCFAINMPALPDGAHEVHLAWPGDLDGDGFTDLVVDRLPTAGGTIRVEAYSTRTRARLWSIDCGPRGIGIVSAGQSDGVTVADFDGDGRCEVVVKSIAGTVFGNGAVVPGSDNTVYLSVVNGLTGAERSRRLIAPALTHPDDAQNIGVGYIDGVRPALVVMDEAKRYTAYDVHPTTHALSVRWGPIGGSSHGHGIRIGDIDGDGKDDVSDLGMAVDDNGTLRFQTDLNHGDRYHIADIDPDRLGLECFAVQQDNPTQLSHVLYDASTGQMLWRKYASSMIDNGRANVGSIDSGYTGMQCWSLGGGGLLDQFGTSINANNPYPNFSIWWDADVLREDLNEQLVNKWNGGRMLTGYNFQSASYGTRNAVPFYGDILGDWREEIVTFSWDGARIVIFSTSKVATSRYYTLLQDPQYRADLTLKGYMQSHHPGFYFGQNMPRPPRAPVWNGDLTWVGNTGGNVWDTATARWKNSATGAATTFADGQSVLFDLTGVSSTAVTLTGTLSPSQVVVHAPKGQSYTFGGAGSLSGSMTLTKGGQGSLTLGGTHSFTGQTIVSEGALIINGSLSGSAVRVDSRGTLGGSGTITSAVSLSELRAGLAPGGVGSAGTLTLSGGLSETGGAVNTFDLASTTAPASNDRVAITGNLTLSGANIIQLNLLNGTLAPGGTYTLFTYTGTFTGNVASLIIRGADAFPCTLANTGSAITLTVGAMRAPATVAWNGGGAGAWTLNGGVGWLKGGATDGFVTGDTATFDNTGSSTPAVALAKTVLPASTVVNSTADYTFSGSGAIGGSGGLTKSGAGTLTLSTVNTYTGPTTINGGVVSVAALADGGLPSPLGAASNASSNLVLNGGTLRLSAGSTSTFRGATLGSAGGTLDLPSGTTLNLSGVITGTGSLTKTGPGLLILNAVNTHSGGTLLQGGRIILAASYTDYSPTSPIQYGLGSGPITLQSGTLSLSDTSQSDLDYVDSRAFWPIVVPAGANARLDVNGRMQLGGALTGAGTLTFYTPFVRTDVTGNWSAFTGRLNVITDGSGGDFRIANSAGLAGAWLDLAANVWAYSRAGSGLTTINIGSLSGAAGSVLDSWTGSDIGSHQPAHWRIGARGDDTTFAGEIRGNSIVTKVGPGTLTLSNAASSFTGGTTVSAGTLVADATGISGGGITVASGATLTFSGGISSGAVGGSGAITNTGGTTITGNYSGFSGTYTHDTTLFSSAFNSAAATSRNAAYHIATAQGLSQGMIAAGNGDYTLEMGAFSGIANSLFRGGNTATGTTTLQIGNLGTDTTFAGSLSNGVTKALALTKVGNGKLTLTGTNAYSGNTVVGTANGAGVLCAAASGALGTGTIIFDGSGGTPGPTSRLELVNGITLANNITLHQRNNTSAAILNAGGDNVLSGAIDLNVGGGAGNIQSDAGLLTLSGNIATTTTAVRNLCLGGAGDGLASGVISNGSGTVNVTKQGAGTWTLGGANTYTGSTTVTAGTLGISQAVLGDATTVNVAATAVLNLTHGATDTVGRFFIDGVEQVAGTWGSPTSTATYKTTRITGTGILLATNGAPTGYGSWASSFGLDPLTDGAPGFDKDLDGLPNLLEYALGADPLAPASSPPVLSQITNFKLQITFQRIADPALTYAVEAATVLSPADWSVVWTSTGEANTAGPVTATDDEPLSAHPSRFLRLRVSRSTP